MELNLPLTVVMMSTMVSIIVEVIKKLFHFKGRSTQVLVFVISTIVTVSSKLWYVNSEVPWFEIVLACFIVASSAIGINQTVDNKRYS